MSENAGRTGAHDASEATRILADPNSTEEEKSVAASDLRQAEDEPGETSARVASEAGQLEADGATAAERSVAASDDFQADHERDENS